MQTQTTPSLAVANIVKIDTLIKKDALIGGYISVRRTNYGFTIELKNEEKVSEEGHSAYVQPFFHGEKNTLIHLEIVIGGEDVVNAIIHECVHVGQLITADYMKRTRSAMTEEHRIELEAYVTANLATLALTNLKEI